jgi:hypothetical protein
MVVAANADGSNADDIKSEIQEAQTKLKGQISSTKLSLNSKYCTNNAVSISLLRICMRHASGPLHTASLHKST